MASAFEVWEETLERTIERSIRVLAVSGDLDLAAVPEFERCLLEFAVGDDPVILDLAGVAFMDSSAIAALIAVRKRANMTRGRFVLVCKPDGDIEHMLSYTGLDAAFDVVATRQQAAVELAAV